MKGINFCTPRCPCTVSVLYSKTLWPLPRCKHKRKHRRKSYPVGFYKINVELFPLCFCLYTVYACSKLSSIAIRRRRRRLVIAWLLIGIMLSLSVYLIFSLPINVNKTSDHRRWIMRTSNITLNMLACMLKYADVLCRMHLNFFVFSFVALQYVSARLIKRHADVLSNKPAGINCWFKRWGDLKTQFQFLCSLLFF